jgi:amino-acid N-acetyltransferase
VPVIPPIGIDGEGHSYRLNSDAVAVEVARALQAVKLIYLTTSAGILLQTPGEPGPGNLLRQLTAEEAETVLRKHTSELTGSAFSKLASAARALRGGVPRVHIIDGGVEEGLLAEVFSNEGIGTLVHANEYQAIRRAQKKDARGISALIKTSVENEELLPRSLAEIEQSIGNYYVFDVDGNLAACVALHPYPDENQAEIACLCVSAKYENQGIGGRMMQYLEEQARQARLRELFCLSTQAVNYFVQKGGFRLATPDDLPVPRRRLYDASGRRSQVLAKKL